MVLQFRRRLAKQKKFAKSQGRRNARQYPRALPRDSCLDDWLERRLYFDIGNMIEQH